MNNMMGNIGLHYSQKLEEKFADEYITCQTHKRYFLANSRHPACNNNMIFPLLNKGCPAQYAYSMLSALAYTAIIHLSPT